MYISITISARFIFLSKITKFINLRGIMIAGEIVMISLNHKITLIPIITSFGFRIER